MEELGEAGDRRSFPAPQAVGTAPYGEGPSLVLRLRAGFGVNVKADLLAILLGMDGVEASLKLLTAAAG